MEPYFEKVIMPQKLFPVKSFVTSTMEHVIEVHPHWHAEIEILYFISGQAKQQVNENIFTAESGDIVVIGKDQLHSTYSYQGNECKVLVIMFDADVLLTSGINYDERDLSISFCCNSRFDNPIKSEAEEHEMIQKCIREVHEELEKKAESL